MCMAATEMSTGRRMSAGQAAQALATGGAQPAPVEPTMPALPQLPTLPTLPTMPAAQQPASVTTAIAGPQAATSAPTAKQGGANTRRRRSQGSGTSGLSIGSTQAAAGAGLNIGR
jgi:hypothetical protein